MRGKAPSTFHHAYPFRFIRVCRDGGSECTHNRVNVFKTVYNGESSSDHAVTTAAVSSIRGLSYQFPKVCIFISYVLFFIFFSFHFRSPYLLMYLVFPVFVGPCHHGMAYPQVADGGTACNMEGGCE